MAELYKLINYRCLATRTDSLLVAWPAYARLRDAGMLSETKLGSLKREYGVIFETKQRSGTAYSHRYLQEDGTVDVVNKGERTVAATLDI
jgi:hypothetical protein